MSEATTNKFEPLAKIIEVVKNVFLGFASVLNRVSPALFNFASAVGGVFENLMNSITNGLNNTNFQALFDMVNGGLFIGIF